MTLLRRRMVAFFVAWTLFYGVNEALFLTSLVNGSGLGTGGVDYAFVFAKEQGFRAHTNDLCPPPDSFSCTPEQAAQWQIVIHEQGNLFSQYHQQFRLDVIERSRAFLSVMVGILAIGYLLIWLDEIRHNRARLSRIEASV